MRPLPGLWRVIAVLLTGVALRTGGVDIVAAEKAAMMLLEEDHRGAVAQPVQPSEFGSDGRSVRPIARLKIQRVHPTSPSSTWPSGPAAVPSSLRVTAARSAITGTPCWSASDRT